MPLTLTDIRLVALLYWMLIATLQARQLATSSHTFLFAPFCCFIFVLMMMVTVVLLPPFHDNVSVVNVDRLVSGHVRYVTKHDFAGEQREGKGTEFNVSI